MKKIFIVMLFFCAYASVAQNPQQKLDQVSLMKQLIGLWRLEISHDSAFFMDLRPYGDTGFVVSTWYVAKGERFGEGQRLYGYDKKSDKYVGMSIRKTAGRITFWTLWFTSDHRLEAYNFRDLFNPSGSVSRRSVAEIKTPDEFFQVNTYPDRPSDTETLSRVNK